MSRKKKTRKDKIKGNAPYTQSYFDNSLGYKDIILTDSQKEFYDVVDNNTITFVEGYAGVGKTLAALYYAVKRSLVNPNDNIIVIRSPVESGTDKIGYLPSGLDQKLEPHFESAKQILSNLLSEGRVQTDLGKRIHFKVPNYCLGSTFDNAVILIDEAQMLTPLIIKLLLERTGKNTKVIISGDSSQIYATDAKRNGLKSALNTFCTLNEETNKYVPKYPNIGYYKFGIKDVVRSDIVKTVLTAYQEMPLSR